LFNNLTTIQTIAKAKRPYTSQEKMDDLPEDADGFVTNAFFLATKSSSVQIKVAVIWMFFFIIYL